MLLTTRMEEGAHHLLALYGKPPCLCGLLKAHSARPPFGMLMGMEERTERGKGHPCSAGAGFKSEFDMHAAPKGKTHDLSLRQKMRPVTREQPMGKKGIPGRTVSSSKGQKGQVGGEKKHLGKRPEGLLSFALGGSCLQVSHSFNSQPE